MQNDSGSRLAIAVAFLAVGVDIGLARLGYGLLLPAIRADLGGGYAIYGAIGAVHLGGYLAGTLAGARIARDRRHLPRIVVVSHAVVALGLAWSAFATTPVLLGLARLVIGMASGIGVAAIITDALERVVPRARGAASGIAWAGIGLGFVVSAPAGPWTIADPMRWREATLWFAAGALGTALAALALRSYAASHRDAQAEQHFAWRDLLTRRYLAFAGAYTCFGIAYISFATFAPSAFAMRGIVGAGLTAAWIGYGAASSFGALAIARVLSGAWHRFAMAIPLAAGAIGAALSELDGAVAAIAGACIVGSSQAATPSVASAFARDRSDAASAARAFAAVTACFGIGQLVGPLISGALADAFGPGSAAALAALVFALGAVLGLIDAQARETTRPASECSGSVSARSPGRATTTRENRESSANATRS